MPTPKLPLVPAMSEAPLLLPELHAQMLPPLLRRQLMVMGLVCMAARSRTADHERALARLELCIASCRRGAPYLYRNEEQGG